MISHCGYPLKRPEAVAGTVDRRRLTAGQLAGGGWPVAGGRCRFARGGWPEAGGRERAMPTVDSESARGHLRFVSIDNNKLNGDHPSCGRCV